MLIPLNKRIIERRGGERFAVKVCERMWPGDRDGGDGDGAVGRHAGIIGAAWAGLRYFASYTTNEAPHGPPAEALVDPTECQLFAIRGRSL